MTEPAMMPDVLIARIHRLETELKEIEAQEKQVSVRKERTVGKLEEMWEWLNTYKAHGDYGEHMEIGQHKPTVKLPVFGDRDKLEEVIANRGKKAHGFDEADVKKVRVERAHKDAQAAVDEIVRMPENDWPWLPGEQSQQP